MSVSEHDDKLPTLIGKKVALVGPEFGSGTTGGAERHYQALLDAIKAHGCNAELVGRPADEPDFSTICRNYEAFAELDLRDFEAVISLKAPSFAVHHPNHIVWLMHTVRAYDDMFDEVFREKNYDHFSQRAEIHKKDFESFLRAKKLFAIGHEVANRLQRWRGLTAEVLHPPLAMSGFRSEDAEDYFFMPGRLHPWKRVHLAIEAVKASALPLKLVISGTGEAEAELRALAEGDSRIQFLGHIDDETLRDLYAKTLAVPFLPIREDYGYVTLEAFASGKPVITCTDSGEPTFFVDPEQTGLICQPNGASVREAFEWLFNNRSKAAQMGRAGKAFADSLSWEAAAGTLLEAAFNDCEPAAEPNQVSVTVTDMQPIEPAIGGGRLRLLGLYHDLGPSARCTYVGTYDWPGEAFRDHMLSEGLREISIPLSDQHHAAAQKLSVECNNKTVIDVSFSELGALSQEFIEGVRQQLSEADVVVFSHPWVYPLVSDFLKPRQLVVYDSHNVESYLRAQLLDQSNEREARLLRTVISDEYALGQRADLILACSHEDLARFHRVYEFEPGKLRVVPNGVMAFEHPVATDEVRAATRKSLKLDPQGFYAVFIGSPYGPNQEAAAFILDELSETLREVTFVIAGGVGEGLTSKHPNVIITGALTEEERVRWLSVCDIAINPMFSGSGTNIKMFDFMALGLPTVTTRTGARGIERGPEHPFLVVEDQPAFFIDGIKRLMSDSDLRHEMAESARRCVEDNYSWERISRILGAMFRARARIAGQPRPMFSVVIPTYERHGQLNELIARLQQQVERDFEVVVVDQSENRWPGADDPYGFPLTYFHSPIKGAVRARNTGAAIAQGEVIAFTDDDCLPEPDWLLNARTYFGEDSVVGVEGRIVSDHEDDPEWRSVTNVGFEGIGFMTANLMVRTAAFHLLGGFDLAFDRPHFREDTDFGWRMQDYGTVPFAHDVCVFHPAQDRRIERESSEVRTRFFRKDALLYKKHPARYRELFLKEGHWCKTEGFLDQIKAGFAEQNLDLPAWLTDAEKN